MYLVLISNLCLTNMMHVSQNMRGFLCLYWLSFNCRKCHEKTTVRWNILDVEMSLVLFCIKKHMKAFGQFMKAGLTFSPLAGLKFLFVTGVLPCKDLSARHHSLCYRPLGKKKKWASVSQNLVQYSETTKEVALCMNPARDLCVRQLTTFERRQKKDTLD